MAETKRKEQLENSLSEIRKRSKLDRRSGEDRRKAYNLDYFLLKNGIERRKKLERRKSSERRSGWVRINEWYSVYIGEYE